MGYTPEHCDEDGDCSGGEPIYDWVTYNESGSASGSISNGSGSVFINGVGVARKGDLVNISKSYSNSNHIDSLNVIGNINDGSSTVYVNGIPMAYNGCSVSASDCSGLTINQGSSNIYVG